MKLYHGSNVGIKQIDLTKGRRGKDFGRGFYLSEDRDQAFLMAQRTVAREESGEPIVTEYEFDESALHQLSGLRVKVFDSYTIEWAEFIMMNRNNRTDHQVHDYDIVFGPIANDKVGLQINRFQLRYISIEELIRQLSFIRPTYQYFFGTERAIKFLIKIEQS